MSSAAHPAWKACIFIFGLLIALLCGQIIALFASFWYLSSKFLRLIKYAGAINLLLVIIGLLIWPLGLKNDTDTPCVGISSTGYHMCPPWKLGWGGFIMVASMVLLAFSACLCTLVSSQAPPKAKMETDEKSVKNSKSHLVELPYSLLVDPRMEANTISALAGYETLNAVKPSLKTEKTRKPANAFPELFGTTVTQNPLFVNSSSAKSYGAVQEFSNPAYGHEDPLSNDMMADFFGVAPVPTPAKQPYSTLDRKKNGEQAKEPYSTLDRKKNGEQPSESNGYDLLNNERGQSELYTTASASDYFASGNLKPAQASELYEAPINMSEDEYASARPKENNTVIKSPDSTTPSRPSSKIVVPSVAEEDIGAGALKSAKARVDGKAPSTSLESKDLSSLSDVSPSPAVEKKANKWTTPKRQAPAPIVKKSVDEEAVVNPSNSEYASLDMSDFLGMDNVEATTSPSPNKSNASPYTSDTYGVTKKNIGGVSGSTSSSTTASPRSSNNDTFVDIRSNPAFSPTPVDENDEMDMADFLGVSLPGAQ